MLRAVLCVLMLCIGFASSAEARRVALVIGNSAYRNAAPLANPLNDARLVADALAASGFEVQLGADLDRERMTVAFQEFALDAMQADVALVYFAGHGLEARGANWLLPVDVNIRTAEELAETSIPFEMAARSAAGAKVKIVALDACRSNPFAARLQSATGTLHRGLAEVELDGYVIMYAAAAGQEALDGTANSPFAQTFARWVGEQTIDLRLLAGKIRDDVIAATAGKQRPFISASLPGEVTVLAPAPKGNVTVTASTRRRRPYYFDYVRTLKDGACVPTRTAKCQTERMLSAGGRPVTLEDDNKLLIWSPGGTSIARTVPASGLEHSDVIFVDTAAALVLAKFSTISVIPFEGEPRSATIEHADNPVFLFAAGKPAVAVFAYPASTTCKLGFVDLASLTISGKVSWVPECFQGKVAWTALDPASDRFAARVTTVNRKEPYKTEELLLVSYGRREIICRMGGMVNDVGFDSDGDLYAAQDDGAVVRYGPDCRAKQTYRLHKGAVDQLYVVEGDRIVTRSLDGGLKLWSPSDGQVLKEMNGLPRDARIIDVAKDGSAALILNEDQRLHVWYGEARLGPYVGPVGPVCAGALSPDHDTLYALKCNDHVEVWQRQPLE
jgi:hypothetical protein